MFDAGVPNAADGGSEDAGVVVVVDAGVPEADAGTPEVDAGVIVPDAGSNPYGSVGPWPDVPVMNYSTTYNIGPVQSVGLDDGQNIWLLSGSKIGVLKPGTTAPTWVSNIGQAAPGFGDDKLASWSTVICGGASGRAYVGYYTYELPNACSKLAADGWNCDGEVTNPEYKKGDMDVVKLDATGNVAFDLHLSQTTSNHGQVQQTLGLRNTNAWIYDEDRSVLSCQRVMKGQNKNDVFIGTNHGVTMIRGTVYNSHRHPSWYKTTPNGQSLMSGYSYGLGFSYDWKDVLIANDWTIGITTAPAALPLWDRIAELPWKLNTFVDPLNSLEAFDFWRGFTQARPAAGALPDTGVYYLASDRFGLWKWTWNVNANNGYREPAFSKVTGLPTDALNGVQATEDGSVFIATNGAGLWRIKDDGTMTHVSAVSGSVVKQLLYDPNVTPASLYVLTNNGLSVLRGH